MGLYQMIFPVYCILLDFSSVGVPAALSKLVAEHRAAGKEEEGVRLLQASFRLLALLGATGSVVLFCFSERLASVQGNALAAAAYRALSPSVFFVSVLSCYRGYFQGESRMLPTASSQVVEQIVKLAGLLFVRLRLPDLPAAAAGAAFAVTLSEGVAAVYLALLYRTERRKKEKVSFDRSRFLTDVGTVLSLSVPVAFAGILIPLSQTADSFLILNLMRSYTDRATALYGLYTGSVLSVVNLPVAICYGVAVAVVPYISGERAGKTQKTARAAILLTLLLSVPAALVAFFAADPIIGLLFSRLTEVDRSLAVGLLKASSLSVVTLSLLQTTNSVLIGTGRAKTPVLTTGVGVIVKIMLNGFLLPLPSLGIYGATIAANACYLVAVILNLMYTLIEFKKKKSLSADGVPSINVPNGSGL